MFCVRVLSLGLLDNALVDRKSTPLDTLSNFLAKRFAYGLSRVFYRCRRCVPICTWRVWHPYV